MQAIHSLSKYQLQLNVTDYCCTFVRSVVCLSIVCHIRARCLNRSTDLDAFWQLHFWSPMTYCLRQGSLTPRGRGDLGVEPPVKTCILQIAAQPQSYAATWRIQTRTAIPPFAKLLSLLLLLLLQHRLHLHYRTYNMHAYKKFVWQDKYL